MTDASVPTLLDLFETALVEARREAAFCAVTPRLPSAKAKFTEIGMRAAYARKAVIDRIEQMYEAVEAIEAVDRRIDDEANDGQNAIAPTGDAYNEVLALVRGTFTSLIDPKLMA